MHISTDLIEQELEKQGRSAEAKKILAELPDKIDHDQHADALKKVGIDPGKLAQQAATKGLETL